MPPLRTARMKSDREKHREHQRHRNRAAGGARDRQGETAQLSHNVTRYAGAA